MRVLWIVNGLFPDICEHLGVKPAVTGGWMRSLSNALRMYCPDIELGVCAMYGADKKEMKDIEIKGIRYFCLPFDKFSQSYNSAMEGYWKEVKKLFNPDVVHIHGTEFTYGLAYMNACGADSVVVSVQGLVGGYARYSLGNIPIDDLKRARTLKDYLHSSLLKVPMDMERRGELENLYFQKAKHVIGRTDWDRDHVWAINPSCKYHFCNETLRPSFYVGNRWNVEECDSHTIFLSQAAKPIKGIHKLVEAMPLILRHYPDAKVLVAGLNFMKCDKFIERLKFGTYANYCRKLMQKHNLEDKFYFCGLLEEEQMVEMYRKSNVFVCPSSIENSPNSVGEAQLIGTPVVASYVGGVPNMIKHNHTGLVYRFEEYEMLAASICRVFGDAAFAQYLSKEEQKEASERHDSKINALATRNIYQSIIKG